jgi:MFS family permease
VLSLWFITVLPPSVGGRIAFGLGAIVALFSLWARRALPESPRWLAARGRVAEAEKVSAEIAGDPPAPAAVAEPTAHTAEDPYGLAAGFSARIGALIRNHPGRLALGCALDFSEAAGYYGLFAILPLVVLPRLHIPDRDVPWFFIIGNVGAGIGGLIAAWALDRAGRKATVTGFYALAAAAMLAMAWATEGGSATGVMLAFTIANLCATGAWIAAYPTFAELFPTGMRATGIGASVAFGRIGAAIAPPLLVAVAEATSVTAAFAAIAGCWLIGVAAMVPWAVWGPEGRGRALEALSPEAATGRR